MEQIINEAMEKLFTKCHKIAKTKSGDMTIDQELRLDKIKKELTELLSEQIKLNKL